MPNTSQHVSGAFHMSLARTMITFSSKATYPKFQSLGIIARLLVMGFLQFPSKAAALRDNYSSLPKIKTD